jgi:hypothetical protein
LALDFFFGGRLGLDILAFANCARSADAWVDRTLSLSADQTFAEYRPGSGHFNISKAAAPIAFLNALENEVGVAAIPAALNSSTILACSIPAMRRLATSGARRLMTSTSLWNGSRNPRKKTSPPTISWAPGAALNNAFRNSDAW